MRYKAQGCPTGEAAEEPLATTLRAMYGEQLLAAEDTRRQLERLRRELAGPQGATPLERLLIERIALCWLQVHHHETIYAQSLHSVSGSTETRLQDRIDRAHRRYESALRSLAQVRRLQIPASLQVNIAAQGGQQVNVAQAVTGSKSLPPDL